MRSVTCRLRTGFLLGTMLALGVQSAQPVPADEGGQSSYAQVRLIALECVKQTDRVGEDEAYLLLDKHRRSPVWGVRSGTTVDLTKLRPITFHRSMLVSLYESDVFDDDHLGSSQLSGKDFGRGARTVEFTGGAGEYRLTYELVKPSGPCARLRLLSLKRESGLAGKDEEEMVTFSLEGTRIARRSFPKGNVVDLSELPASAFCKTAALSLHASVRSKKPRGEGTGTPPSVKATFSLPMQNLGRDMQVLLTVPGSPLRYRLTYRMEP